MLAFLFFFISAFLTVVCAFRLSFYADNLARVTSIGRGFVGLFLLSAITSMPELFSSSSSVLIGNLDLAVGNIFGSNMTNMFILVFLDFFMKKNVIWLYVKQSNLVTGFLFISFQSFVLLVMFLASSRFFSFVVDDFTASFFSLFIVLVYIVSMYVIYDYEKSVDNDFEEDEIDYALTRNQIIGRFILFSVLIFFSAIFLSYSCDMISRIEISGNILGGTFVGTLFMSVATSLPEFIVAFASIRLGAYDMAFSNLFGSNIFNLLIIGISDFLLRISRFFAFISNDSTVLFSDFLSIFTVNIFQSLSSLHFISGFFAIIIISIVMGAILIKPSRQIFFVNYFNVLVFFIYLIGMYLIFFYSRF